MAQSKVSSLEGNELEEGYVRTHVPKTGRWGDTWELFKSNFVSFVIINVLTLLFFVPGIAILYFRSAYITQMGLLYPLSFNALGVGPFTPSTQGVGESIVLSADLLFMSLLVVAGFIASVGVAGACYSVKKMINTHGQFRLKDYFRGIKVCYLNVVFPVTIFMVFLFGSFCVSDWSALTIAEGASKGGPITAQVFMIIATVMVGIIAMWVLAVGVSYKVKFKYLMKNSFVLLIGTIVQSLFMVGFTLLPVWVLMLGKAVPLFQILGYIFFIFIGFSFMALCWMAYTQWVFDMFITPAVKSQEEARKASLTPKQLAMEQEEDEKAQARELLAAGKSELVGRPVRPIEGGSQICEVGVAYGRADIAKSEEQRGKIKGEIDEYYNEHRKETKYVEYEKMFAEREKALKADNGKKGKKKKVSKNNLLGN
ncbi:MAG: hypothetical protein ACI4MS_05880 [Candidatus Coproplasma sp.]